MSVFRSAAHAGLIFSLVLGLATPVSGSILQPMRLDVGSFTVFANDQRVGREQFSLQRVGGGDGIAFELRAESAVGDRRTAMRLETDSAGTPVRYSVEERLGPSISLRLGGQRVRGRFATLARSPNSESAREFILTPGALVIEDDGFLQYAMLVRQPLTPVNVSTTISILTPVANRQGTLQLQLEARSDTVIIAGSRRAARRWRVFTDQKELRYIWADAQGRLLRVTIPSRGLDAIRDDVPRSL